MTLDQIDWHNSLSIIVQLLNPSGSLISNDAGSGYNSFKLRQTVLNM